jgi:L-ascorbate metabolism protein UlaG (beta-lactamase superfamily)
VLDRFTWFRQSALRWVDDERTIYIDPWGTDEDAPPADLILLTHAHDVADLLEGDVTPVAPGQTHQIAGVSFTTVPAYNTNEERLDFHPKANKWVGYVLELGGATYYHAGDTDHAPELDDVKTDVAFLPIGGYYTMEWNEAAGLAKSIAPRIAVPMHYGFVVGSPSDADRFKEAAAPVEVQTLTPTNPFEME